VDGEAQEGGDPDGDLAGRRLVDRGGILADLREGRQVDRDGILADLREGLAGLVLTRAGLRDLALGLADPGDRAGLADQGGLAVTSTTVLARSDDRGEPATATPVTLSARRGRTSS
jgi:hypothetical protein